MTRSNRIKTVLAMSVLVVTGFAFNVATQDIILNPKGRPG